MTPSISPWLRASHVESGTTTNSSIDASSIAENISQFLHSPLPPDVADSAKQCVLDWFCVCIAGSADPESAPLTNVIHGQRSQGNALALDGRRGAAAPMALVNAVLAHTAEFDDFHLASAFHASAPTFAAALALGMDRKLSGADILAGFVAGFEVGAQLGLEGAGVRLAQRGWHPTSILGHFSATAACAALLKLPPTETERALGFAAVQAGGLMSAAGTMSKAFLVGKAAMNGVMAAELAENGALAPTHLLDSGPQGLFNALFQSDYTPRFERLGQHWQITQNTYKPYPACQLVHASFDAASAASRQLGGRSVRKVRAFVNPFALTIANQWSPGTSLEARFSLNYCIALGLLGYGATMDDFSESRLADPVIRQLSQRIEAVPQDSVERWGSRLEINFEDGSVLTETVVAALGSLGRPMRWPELENKFLAAVSPVIGSRSHDLLAALRAFDQPGALEEIEGIISSTRPA